MSYNEVMGTLIDGKAIAAKIHKDTADRVAALAKRGHVPKLAVILVGDDPASLMYDRMKGAAAQKIGIDFTLQQFPASISPAELIEKINLTQSEPSLSGLILQLPLPEHLYIPEVLSAIQPNVDVDFLSNYSLGSLIMNTNTLLPPTPGAVVSILEELNVNLIGKNVTIIGAGNLVGKPLAVMMMNARASVTTCNSKTRDAKEKCLAADIIVTGVGKKGILCGDMVRKGAIVIDTGIAFENGKVFGDVNVDEVVKIAAYVTPTPGGVGPITVARLLANTVAMAEKLYAK